MYKVVHILVSSCIFLGVKLLASDNPLLNFVRNCQLGHRSGHTTFQEGGVRVAGLSTPSPALAGLSFGLGLLVDEKQSPWFDVPFPNDQDITSSHGLWLFVFYGEMRL